MLSREDLALLRADTERVGRLADREGTKNSAGRTVRPRPSLVLAEILRRPERRAWATEHRAEILAFAAEHLPNQPRIPLTPPPRDRRIDPPKEGILGVVLPGATKTSRPIAAEAFTGGGLFTLAAAIEGVYAPDICEFDASAVATLKENLHSHAITEDALDWTPEIPHGGLDLLIGGPPCQPFSQAASLGGGLDIGPSSARNMYPRVLDWIADARPRIVILENASAVARNADFRSYFDRWMTQLGILGYEGVFHVLAAADYGTPQNRERAFLFAWPKGVPWGDVLQSPPTPTHHRPDRPGPGLPWVRAFDRLTSGCCGGYGLIGCVNLGNLERSCESCVEGSNFQSAPNQTGEQARRRPSEALIRNYAGMFNATARMAKRRPTPGSVQAGFKPIDPRIDVEYLAPAVVAGGGGKRGQDAFIVPEHVRNLVSTIDLTDPEARRAFAGSLEEMSVREAAKLQDVPQWWAFCGSRGEAYRQIGNGIPVNLGRAVIRHALDALGYETPLEGSMADLGNQGLWPIHAIDPCGMNFLGTHYPGSQVPYTKASPRPWNPEARPYPDEDAYQAAQWTRRTLEERRELWHQGSLDEPALPDHEAYFRLYETGKWKPMDERDAPPGFFDVEELWGIVDGEDPEVFETWEAIYAKAASRQPTKTRQEDPSVKPPAPRTSGKKASPKGARGPRNATGKKGRPEDPRPSGRAREALEDLTRWLEETDPVEDLKSWLEDL